MRNQISGSITFDTTALAEALAAQLAPSLAASPPLPQEAAILALTSALPPFASSPGHPARHDIARYLLEELTTAGLHLAASPTASSEPATQASWFDRSE